VPVRELPLVEKGRQGLVTKRLRQSLRLLHCPDISKWTADRYIKVFNRFKEGAKMHLENDTVEEDDFLQMSVTQAYITLGIVKVTSQVGVKSSRNQKILELEQEVQKLRAENQLLKTMINEMSDWLTDEQQTELEQIAQEKQIEFGEILRETVELYLSKVKNPLGKYNSVLTVN